MRKTLFDGQGMILNGFERNIFLKKRFMARKTPHPPSRQMPLKISIFFGNPSLTLDPLLFVVFVFVIKDDINPPPGE